VIFEHGHHRFGFAGSHRALLETVQATIVSSFRRLADVEAIRFVGSASLQRPIEESRVVDLDVHIVLRDVDWETFTATLDALADALARALPEPGRNLASIGVIRGPYKPAPIAEGTRVFVHAMIGDWNTYLRANSMARFSWAKYAPAFGSFALVDSQVSVPSLRDAIDGRAGLARRADRIRGGRAQLTLFERGPQNSVAEVDVETEMPAVLHELFASSPVYGYRHLCRALGLLDESLTNAELVIDEGGEPRDRHRILLPREGAALAECVRSKYRLRGGSIEELTRENLSRLQASSLEFLDSVAGRFRPTAPAIAS
jgi:hypothetical protein